MSLPRKGINQRVQTDVIALLNLLEEEFQNLEVKLVPVFPSGTARSPDLPQDYDPEASDLHSLAGVKALTGRREFFFPQNWYAQMGRTLIHQQIEEIREALDSN